MTRRLTVLCVVACMSVMVAPSAARASGAWTVETTPTGDGVTLTALSCFSNGCIAVGLYDTGDAAVYGWNGSTWAALPVPAKPLLDTMNGVACSSSSDCIAVGHLHESQGWRAQAWSWNGSAWSVQATFNPPSSHNSLNAIRCAAGTSSCEAVGYRGYGGPTYPLAEYWNGRAWAYQSTKGGPIGDLMSLSCAGRGASLGACEAVGQNGFSFTALAMGLNGATWITQATPALPHNDQSDGPAELTAVSCYRSGCMAVGWESYSDGTPDSSGNQSVGELWNGSKWTLAGVPYRDYTSDTPTAVNCRSASSCTAVGWLLTCGDCVDYTDTLVLSWDGTQWTQATAPSPNDSLAMTFPGDALNAVACVSGVCTAVGQQPDVSTGFPDSLAIQS